MHFAKLILLALTVSLVSCKLKPDTPIAKPQSFDKKSYADSLKEERNKLASPKKENSKKQTDSLTVQAPTNPSIPETVDTIFMKIVYGKAKIDTVKLPRQRLVFLVNSDTANKLKIKLSTPDSLANVRISQIIDSKGNSDGPFGRDLDYEIKEKGIQKIIVSESQMQGDAWGGKIQLDVKLAW